jgi:hypothetical protein
VKKFVVVDLDTSLYLVPKTVRDYNKRIEGGNFDEARLFNNRSSARQAANRWKPRVDIAEVDVTLSLKTPLAKPEPTPSFGGVGVLKFRDVAQFYRTNYSVDLVGNRGAECVSDAPIIQFLENNNKFLREMVNGNNILINEKCFEKAPIGMKLIAKYLIDELGVDSPVGKFCLFEIDWKDEDGKIRADY